MSLPAIMEHAWLKDWELQHPEPYRIHFPWDDKLVLLHVEWLDERRREFLGQPVAALA